MLMNITSEQACKENLIRLAREHRRHCCGAECGISLYWLRWLLDEAEIPLTLDEQKEFM